MLSQVIEQRWGVCLKANRIYEILHSLGLSHQRGHRDYANADRQAQQFLSAKQVHKTLNFIFALVT